MDYYSFKKLEVFFIRVFLAIGIILLVFLFLNNILNYSIKDINKNISIEVKEGKIIDSSKESVQGLLGGHIEYETAIKVDDEIIISKDEKIYYEAIDKIGKEVKVEVKNDKNIDKKSIVDIK